MSKPDFLGPATRRASGRFELVHVESGAVLASRVIVGGDRSLPVATDAVRIASPARWLHTMASRAPVDVAFVAADGTLLEIRRAMKPWRLVVGLKAHAVIEAAQGFFERSETQAGDRVAVREAQAARPVRDLVAPPRDLESVPPGIQELDMDADPWDVGAVDATPLPAARGAAPGPAAGVAPLGQRPAPAHRAPEPPARPAGQPRAAAASPVLPARPRLQRAPVSGATLAQILARQTPIEWFEAVAIVQDLCHALLEDPPPGGRGVPDAAEIAVVPEGRLELLAAGLLDTPVERVARLLHALAEGTALPVQLRLLVLQELSPSPGCKWVLEFTTRLALFERPGRANLIRAVYERYTRLPPRETGIAAVAPAARPAHPPVEREPWWQRRAVRVGGGAALVLLGLFVAGTWLWHGVSPPPPGTPDKRGAVARAVGDAGASVASAASEGAKTVSRWFGLKPSREPDATLPIVAVEPPPRPVNANPQRPAARTSKPTPAAPLPESEAAPTPTGSSQDFYSAANPEVVPPTLIRSRLPSSPPRGVSPETLPEVEAMVSATGQVESVKLVTADAGVLPAMMLSAIKNWRFHPATRDGQPVRYRLRIRLTNQ